MEYMLIIGVDESNPHPVRANPASKRRWARGRPTPAVSSSEASSSAAGACSRAPPPPPCDASTARSPRSSTVRSPRRRSSSPASTSCVPPTSTKRSRWPPSCRSRRVRSRSGHSRCVPTRTAPRAGLVTRTLTRRSRPPSPASLARRAGTCSPSSRRGSATSTSPTRACRMRSSRRSRPGPASGIPGNPGRLALHRRPQPRDRPAAAGRGIALVVSLPPRPNSSASPEDPEEVPIVEHTRGRRRAAAAHAAVLPPGARPRRAGRAHPAAGRRPHHAEIAAAYLVPEATLAQRIVRAKRKIRRRAHSADHPCRPRRLGSRRC